MFFIRKGGQSTKRGSKINSNLNNRYLEEERESSINKRMRKD